jgi:ribosomal protein L11 methyltransferase
VEGAYDLILANIHRNILVAQMPEYAAYLTEGGKLWLSGFYAEDIVYLEQAAQTVGLQLMQAYARGEWQMLQFEKIKL